MVGAELWRQWNLHRHVALMTLAIKLMIVIVTLFINLVSYLTTLSLWKIMSSKVRVIGE
jgi:hypothetical protein